MAKDSAFGAQLQIGSTSVIATATYTTVANVRSITPPNPTTDMIDVSTHDDADRYRTFVAGRIDAGEVTIEGLLDPANATHIGAAGLQGLRDSGELRAFKIIYPDDGALEVAFQGIVTAFQPGPLAHDGAMEFSASIKVSGSTTYTA